MAWQTYAGYVFEPKKMVGLINKIKDMTTIDIQVWILTAWVALWVVLGIMQLRKKPKV